MKPRDPQDAYWFMKIYSFLIPILAIFASSFANGAAPKPNLIIVFCDDLGYADIGPFGSKTHATPVLDRMAEEGMRLTDFYSTCPVCTPSRSSLMTGCYPRRVNMHVDEKNLCVLFPAARKGLNPSETTIAEVLKEQGYATACIGKWHLGDHPDFMPTNHGFDSYFGIPYSNDMNRKTVPSPSSRLDRDRGQCAEGYHHHRTLHRGSRFLHQEEQQKAFLPLSSPHRRSSAFGAGKKIQGNKREWSLWGLDSGNRLVDGRALQRLETGRH